MLVLTGFADEASPDLSQALDCFQSNGLKHIELRSVEETNVLKLTDDKLSEISDTLEARGFKVSAIGSPIGKVKLDVSWEDHQADFRRAVEVAGRMSAPFIRLFSYYPAGDSFVEGDREEIIRRLGEQAKIAADAGVTLVLENESNIYGESGAACADLLSAVNHPNLRMAFDFCNFVYKRTEDDVRDCWDLCKEYVVYFHIKDCVKGTDNIVPAGQGDGKVEEILADAVAQGFEGFLSMEPHLSRGGQFGGFTGPELYTEAINALKTILDRIGADYDTK